MGENEVSVMSGMSDMSGVGGGGQDQEKDDDRKKIIPLMTVCCLLIGGAVAFAFARLNTFDDAADKGSTEDPDYVPAAPGGAFSPSGGVPTRHPGPPPSAAPQPGSVTKVAKKKRKQMPPRPLVCNVNRDMQVGFPYPDDGICDFMFLTVGLDNHTDEFTYGSNFADETGKLIINEYAKQAEKSQLTEYGADLYDHSSEYVVEVMRKEVGKNLLRKLWKSNVHHYSSLDMSVYTNVLPEYLDRNIEIMQISRDLCTEYKELQEEENCFIFLGIAPLVSPSFHEFYNITRAFELLVSEIKPDALLFRTTLTDRSGFCQVVSPSQWQTAVFFVPEQTTFADVFQMRENVTWPDTIPQLMSFGPHCILLPGLNSFDADKVDIGLRCHEFSFIDCSYRCEANQTLGVLRRSKDGMDQFYVNETERVALTFDNDETMKKKMCRAAVEHNFTGSWAMLNLEYATQDGSACTDMKYKGNFQLLKALKEFMNLNFTTC